MTSCLKLAERTYVYSSATYIHTYTNQNSGYHYDYDDNCPIIVGDDVRE